jgi:hypothetical protein
MALLPIDATSAAWRLVLTYAADRRKELATECCAMGTTPARREELAARIAELDELIDAPAAARRTAEGAEQGATMTLRVY